MTKKIRCLTRGVDEEGKESRCNINNNNNNKNNNMLVNVAISGDRNMIKKEAEKNLKYKDLK
jgi:hypothetical protein